MDLRYEIVINAPARRVWETLGERFMHVSEWAAPITSSFPLDHTEPGVGITRCCTISAFGPVKPGVVQERLTRFDREQMTFEYEALEPMPAFVKHAVNRWSVVPLDGTRSIVRTHATLGLHGAARLLSWLVKWQLQSGGTRVLEELKYYVENGEPHPRKRAASQARAFPMREVSAFPAPGSVGCARNQR